MDVETLKAFLLWCTVINFAMLAVMFGALALMGDFVYRLHGRWFPMPRETWNATIYTMMGVYKLLVIVFNFVPWLVLLFVK